MPADGDIDILEAALNDLVDDGEFHDLDERLARFNLFEAMGGVRAELRHSNFLAFLFSPSRAHGLGALVLEKTLRAILASTPASQRPIRTLELVVADLDDAVVHRERDNIDLLIELRALNLVVMIENKVGAGAGDGQLERYRTLVERRYPNHKRLLVFLTPNGDPPECDGYVSFSYQALASVLADLAALKSTPAELGLILTHYVEMLRRHVVPDEDLKALALRLYDKHREAFDFVFETRPQPQGLLDRLKTCVLGVQGLAEDRHASNLIRFYPERWDKLDVFKCDPSEWSKTGRGLLFEGKINPNNSRLHVVLMLGPCVPAVRQKFYELAQKRPAFRGLTKPLGLQTSRFFNRELLTPAVARTLDFDQQLNAVGMGWSGFQSEDLMTLITEVEAIAAEIS